MRANKSLMGHRRKWGEPGLPHRNSSELYRVSGGAGLNQEPPRDSTSRPGLQLLCTMPCAEPSRSHGSIEDSINFLSGYIEKPALTSLTKTALKEAARLQGAKAIGTMQPGLEFQFSLHHLCAFLPILYPHGLTSCRLYNRFSYAQIHSQFYLVRIAGCLFVLAAGLA